MKNLRLLLIGSSFLLAAMTTCFVDAWVVTRATTHRHAHSSTSSSLAFSSNDNNDNSMIEFNDFEDNNNQDDDTENASIQASLQQQLQAQAEAQAQMIAQTVNQANWNVRGFSLDPFASESNSNEESNEEKITITALAYDEERQWIVCGRSDGSLVVVSLGTSRDEVLATFGTTQLPQFTDQNTLEWKNQLSKQQETDSDDGFELIAHITPFKEWTKPAVDKIALTPNHIYASHVGKGLVEVLEIMDDTDDSTSIERSFLSDLMMGPPVLLSTSSKDDGVYSMDPLGMLAVWKDDSTELEIRGKLDLQEYAMGDVAVEAIGSIHIQSTYMDEYIYVGTDHGQVWVYDVSLLGTSPRPLQPLLRLKAFDDHVNVTAVASNGPGVLGSTSTKDQTTISLLAAGSNGMLKQFELIPKIVASSTTEDDSETFTLEYWPKMPQQTIPNRPHVLQDEGGPVLTSIRSILSSQQNNELIVATSLEDCFVWNVSDDSKKPIVELSGFTNLTSAIPTTTTATTDNGNNSLMLLCNGMEQFVAIHDFSATADDDDFMESFDLTDE